MIKVNSFNIISDTHGINTDTLIKLAPIFNQGDFLVFLGDGLRDIEKIEPYITCPIYAVQGNCDPFTSYCRELVLETDCGNILITHGHEHGVKSGNLLNLYYAAAEKNCLYVLYGHTHIPSITVSYGITMINPGSLGRPRLSKPSYCAIVREGKQLAAKIVSL